MFDSANLQATEGGRDARRFTITSHWKCAIETKRRKRFKKKKKEFNGPTIPVL